MKLASQLFFVVLLFGSAAFAQDDANLTDGCVSTYDATTDYFPDKTEVEYAEGFTIEYFDHYKVLTVTRPWVGAETPFTYALVQCGTPTPETGTFDVVIEVPINRIVSMSTTYLPGIIELGALETLVGVDEFDFVYSDAVRAKIDAGELTEVGGGSLVNVEQVLDLEADVVLTYGIGISDYDAHPQLIAAGVPVVLNGDFNETSPLGRAEWIKFTAAFYNREAEATAFFDEVAMNYTELAEQAAGAAARPTVLVNAMFGDTWYVSGGQSYIAQLIEDAGGAYVWADDESTGGLALSFESVLDTAQNADVWLNPNFWLTLADGLAEDERYSEFAAFESGQVYNNVARVTPMGGNDATELGALRPDLLLADMVAILHPALLPDHDLFFYQQLQ
jgi:iron complex transport system substrate-binding protein